MRRDSRSPKTYRADVSGEQRKLLERIREVIFEVAPDVEEGIEHGMLDYPGVANLAAQKHYVALYVAPAVLAQHREAFSGIDAGKSCLRFKRSEQLDSAALRKLLDAVVAFRRGQPGDDTVHQRLSR
jgi:uncharacterized protein YdhG (YjbR/CyaY superfamily)